MMTTAQLESLKADFLQWTGGFEPESDEDIATYTTVSMPYDFDEVEAGQALRHWMRDADSSSSRRDAD